MDLKTITKDYPGIKEECGQYLLDTDIQIPANLMIALDGPLHCGNVYTFGGFIDTRGGFIKCGHINTRRGSIYTHGGDIYASEGIDTHGGSIYTFGGDIHTHRDIYTFGGDIHTHSGFIDTHGGFIDTHGRFIDTRGRDIDTRDGDIKCGILYWSLINMPNCRRVEAVKIRPAPHQRNYWQERLGIKLSNCWAEIEKTIVPQLPRLLSDDKWTPTERWILESYLPSGGQKGGE